MKGTHRLLLLLALALPAGGAACGRVLRDRPRATVAPEEAARLLPELWRDRGAIAALDLFHGAGSAQGAPRASGPWRFKLKDTTGFSPGWDVVDESGTEWSVKQGP